MTKEQMINEILKDLKVDTAEILRVYGVCCGVGYDLQVILNTGEVLEAHALRTSWGVPGHLRPNNPQYQYSGKCDRYQSEVIRFWKSGYGLKEYLLRLTKKELLNF